MIHEQVKMQLEYLKNWVEAEKEMERRCGMWGIPYTPSRRKWEDIDNYEKYKMEIRQNGDKNLLVMVRLKGGDVNMYGVYPFARRYVYEEYLVYRFPNGGELLLKESEIEVVRKD